MSLVKYRAMLLAGVAGFALFAAAPANAGNILLTGHDTDLHFDGFSVGVSSAAIAFAGDIKFVRAGSSLPVLTFDSGSELTNSLTALGIAFTNIDPNNAAAVTTAMAGLSAGSFSAIAVASEVDCGGCDNSAAGLANLATHVGQIAAFLSAGGGILGFAGADDPTAYAYVPTAAGVSGGSPPANGFVETLAGTTAGLFAENGDPTHNFFSAPGTGGVDPGYVVAETNSGSVETLIFSGGATCTGSTCTLTSTPLPAALPLLGIGLGSLGLFGGWRRKRKPAAFAA